MRTDDLVQALVADRATAPPLGTQFAWALAAGLVLSAAGFLLVLGPRPDIGGAVGTIRFDIKIVQVLLLAVTAFTMPIAVWIIKTAIDSIPVEIEEAARVDGCPSFGIMSMVTLPLVAPSLAAAAVLCFFDGWNEFMFATTFIQEKDKWAASTGLAAFVGEFVTPINTVFAAAVWFTLPAVVFFLLLQRRIIGGLSAGSVKG